MEERKRCFDPQTEMMPVVARRQFYDRKIREIIRYAFDRCPGFRAVMEKNRLVPDEIMGAPDLVKIPILRKTDLPHLQAKNPPFGGFAAKDIRDVKRVFQSPGPIYEPEGRRPDYWNFAKALYAAGFRKGDIVINTTSYHLSPLGFMLDEGLQAIGCVVVPTGPGNTDIQIGIIKGLAVEGYVGTPSFLGIILKRAEELGVNIRNEFSLKRAFVLAEMLSDSARKEFEDVYGLYVRQAYGTADIGIISYECSEKNGMHIIEDVFVEILDPETGEPVKTGEPGEVVFTAFNETYPLIRFATGDLSILSDEPCPCGRTSSRLLKILGRVGEATKVRGLFIYPWQVDQVVSRCKGISRYQLVITRKDHRDEMVLMVELEDEGIDRNLLAEQLRNSIREIMKLRGEVEFVSAGTIPDKARKIDDRRKWD